MLGEKIKELREARSITQDELATVLGLSRPTITKYERDERVPDLIIANRMAEHFGVSLDYLVGRKPSIKEKIAYEIVAMFERNGLTDDDALSRGFKTLLRLLSCVIEVYSSSKQK
jgi:transcriptional regulator with XRE-family HTH domain